MLLCVLVALSFGDVGWSMTWDSGFTWSYILQPRHEISNNVAF